MNVTFTHNLPEDSPSAMLLESLEGYPDAITDIVVEPVGKGRAARNRPHIYATCIDCTSPFKFEIRSLSKRKDTGLRCRKCMNKVKPRKVARGPNAVPLAGGLLLHTGLPNPGIRKVLKTHEGKFVAIQNGEVVDCDDDEKALVRRVLSKYKHVYVEQVLKTRYLEYLFPDIARIDLDEPQYIIDIHDV